MSSQIQEALWRDAQHWKYNRLYRCPRDSRIVVPARSGRGWTLNFAHRSAYLLATAVALAIIVPASAAFREGRPDELPRAIFMSAGMISIIILCATRIGRH